MLCMASSKMSFFLQSDVDENDSSITVWPVAPEEKSIFCIEGR